MGAGPALQIPPAAQSQDRRFKMPLLIALTFAAVLIVAATLWWAKWKTYHYAVVQQGVLYRAGNRGMRELAAAIESQKIRTIVPLIDDAELSDPQKPQFAAELAWCKAHGVRVERIPIPLGGWPSAEDVRKFLAIVSDRNNQPVLVHCAQGVRRTGMMVAAYEQSVLGWDDARCKSMMLTFGHSQRTVGDVQRFIDGYDPVAGTVPEGLPVGKE